MPGPYDELEKEAENLERQSKEEFKNKNFISAISLLEEAQEILNKLGLSEINFAKNLQRNIEHVKSKMKQ